jgi:predicted Rossmann fold flavoprotein
MRIAIVGGGAAGIYAALNIKKEHPNFEIHIFEKEKKLGRKLCATGNGRCNLLNRDLVPSKYNHPSVFLKYSEEYPFESLCAVINSYGVPLRDEDGYLYPESYSAVTYTDFLTQLLSRYKVVVHLECGVSEYLQKGHQFEIAALNCGDFGLFDKVILTTGGASTPNLGSDGAFFPLLSKHGYKVIPLRPGLCPIKTAHPELLKPLAGIRRPALVRGIDNGKEIFNEEGEALFKEDGLSGIVIFNLESALLRANALTSSQVHLNLLPDVPLSELVATFGNYFKLNKERFLEAYFPKQLVDYIYKINHLKSSTLKESDLPTIAASVKDLIFIPTATYPFASSQVTLGGVSFDDVDSDLQSKKEPGVYFAGEVLDMDGFCGGYNLAWALISSLVISESLQ